MVKDKEKQKKHDEKFTKKKQLKQKDAVFKYYIESLERHNVDITEKVPLKSHMNKSIRAMTRRKLYNGFKNKEVRLNSDYSNGKLKKYCSSLIDNWMKKDERYE